MFTLNDPNVFYKELRLFNSGVKDFLYEGVNKYVNYDGGNAGNSPSF
jgi:hypothetical protein